ncbi:hypothetical protein QUB68_28090 [Microcoleus sp. A006_D1]|uniref:hypothetical protein n=1 Tax=Microcoleus sp. A006_D1 TaxID=3055267 RepID=UPI002FD774E0
MKIIRATCFILPDSQKFGSCDRPFLPNSLKPSYPAGDRPAINPKYSLTFNSIFFRC